MPDRRETRRLPDEQSRRLEISCVAAKACKCDREVINLQRHTGVGMARGEKRSKLDHAGRT
eukprot:5097433-Pleurochrysis_carterae.AAC.1